MTSIFRNKYNNQGVIIASGLWQFCIKDPNLGSQCSTITYPNRGFYPESFSSKTKVAAAFITLACIISCFSAFSILSTVTTNEHRKIALWIGRILATVSLIMGIIGVATGMNIITETRLLTKLGWGASAIIAIIAVSVNFCGAITSFLIKQEPSIESVKLEG